jgi:hypothetical protein
MPPERRKSTARRIDGSRGTTAHVTGEGRDNDDEGKRYVEQKNGYERSGRDDPMHWELEGSATDPYQRRQNHRHNGGLETVKKTCDQWCVL